MAVITVRNLPEETARALKARAARSGRSTEAEVREILNASVRPPVAIGSALAWNPIAADHLTAPV